MMHKERSSSTDYLLSRILSGKACSDEVDQFAAWIKVSDNERYFEDYKQVWHTLNSVCPEQSTEDNSLRSFLNYIEKSKRTQRLRRGVLYTISAAASLLIIAGIYTLIDISGRSSIFDNLSFTDLKYNNDSIKVELSDGSVINPLGKQYGISENVRELSYLESEKSKPEKSDTLKFNSVTIPPGERFAVVLSDGTKVYLHSGSNLRYPVSFGSVSRDVTLEGRAYFDVSKSKVPFIVTTEDMRVEVLGTSFDVEAKRSAARSSVILIEGSVKVHTKGESRIISPDEMLSFNREVSVTTVKNVDSRAMTQWKDGILVLRDISFNDMLECLANWYGVEIVNRSSVSEYERFNGKFDRENIEAAVKTVALSARVRYRIEKGKLIMVDNT